MSMPATDHAPVGSTPVSRYDGALSQNGKWDQYKPLIRRLYMDEKKTLVEVREHMMAKYNFTAS